MAKNDIQKTILDEIKGLRKDLSGELKKKAETLDRLLELLKPIQLHVKHIAKSYDDQGNLVLKILYESEVQEVHFSPTDEPRIDEFITSANMLNLIPYDDMEKIHKAISIAESKKNY